MTKTYKFTVIIFLLLILAGVGHLVFYNKQKIEPDLGGVEVTGEYYSTSTASFTGVRLKTAEFQQEIATATPQNIWTTLGSVIVASSTQHAMKIYDATSTAALTNTPNTKLVATIGTSTAQGTYTFDSLLRYGLILELEAGFNGDYIITYRR